jgi:processive 1,2-diacylglycerol beta-glucosyltransferase
MRLAALIEIWGLNSFSWFPNPFAKKEETAVPAAPSMQGKQVLVLSASIGAGHVRAAEALCASAALHDYGASVRHLDTMAFVSPWFKKIYADAYLFLVNHCPSLWGLIYRKTNHFRRGGPFNRLRSLIERLSASSLMQEIGLAKPDAIICTHFFPAELLARLRRQGKINCPVWVQITDFDLHSSWVHHGLSGYFVASHEISFLLQQHGIPAHAIHVTGIPIMPAFGQSHDRRECALELGLDPGKKTVLLSGGGEGIGRLEDVAARLLLSDRNLQLIVLAGRNIGLLKKLQTLSRDFPGRLVPLGFTRQVERVMACCDFAVTKPGGLTSSECLVMGLPMVLSSAIPGQEERNADFLLEQGVALKAPDARALDYRVRELIAFPAKLDGMRAKAKALGREHAAWHALNNIQL